MNKKTLKIAGWALGLSMAVAGIGFIATTGNAPLETKAATTYEQLTSISSIDGSARYVLGIDGTGFHYSGTSSWGLTALPASQTPLYYTLTKANDNSYFKAKTTIGNTDYYLQVPTSNTFSMSTSSTAENTSLIIGTTQINTTNYAVTNSKTTTRHLRINGTSGLRSYAGTTGSMAYFYKVNVSVDSVSLNKSSTTLTVGNTETLTATVTPDGAASVTWSTSDGSVATVSNGTITAVAAGTATITASAGGKTATCDVTVEAATAPRITVSGTDNLYVGDDDIVLTATPENFSPASYTWTSSDSSVATVSGSSTSGTVHAVAKGEVTITATAKNGLDDVVSNSFTFTVKKFGIAADVSSVSSKANKDTAINITPVDASGDVTVTAVSANTSVATVSVVGSVVTVSTGEYGNTSTNVTISATDGVHVADNIVIPVEVQGGYSVGSKVTALPGSDKLVYLVADKDETPKYVTSAINKVSEDDSEAALFYLSSTGTLKLKDSSPAAYVYNGGSNTTVSSSANAAEWSNGMSNETYPGLLQLSGGRFLTINGSDVKAYAASNLGSSTKIYAYEAVASEPTVELNANTASATVGTLDSLTYKLTLSNFLPTGLTVSYLDEGAAEYSESSDIAAVSSGYALGDNAISINFKAVGSTTVKFTVAGAPGGNIDKTLTVNVLPVPTAVNVKVSGQVVAPEYVMSRIIGGYKQPTVEVVPGEASQDYTMTVLSETVDGAFTIDNKKIYFNKVATGVVRITANALPSVYFDLNVKGDPDVVTSLEATVDKDFYVGDTITKSDIRLTATYEVAGPQVIDAANYDFSNYTFTYADAPTGGATKDNKVFNLSYGGQACELTVKVSREAHSDPVTSMGHTGSEFSTAGIVGSYTENQTAVVDGITFNVSGYIYNSKLSLSSSKSEAPGFVANTTAYPSGITDVTVDGASPDVQLSVDGKTGWTDLANADTNAVTYRFLKIFYKDTSVGSYVNITSISVSLQGESAESLANYVMYEDTTNQCESKFGGAKSIFNNLSSAEKTLFMTDSGHVISSARARLLAWAAHEGEAIELEAGEYVVKSSANVVLIGGGELDAKSSLPIVITILSAGALAAGGLFLARKRRSKEE